MDIKNEVLYRVYIVLSLIILFAAAIFVKTIKISVVDGEYWRELGQKQHIDTFTVKADRGNIITENGSLLATSLPFFDIHFDTSIPDDQFWKNNIDSLALCLATFVNEENQFTAWGYRDSLQKARTLERKYLLIKKNATFLEYEQIKKFPIFRKGRYKGGFIAEEKFNRRRPYGLLARRTLGYVNSDGRMVGLEGYFDRTLRGADGKRLKVYEASSKTLIPLHDFNEIEPIRGDDIVTTIDVDIQDIVQKALMRGMEHHQAERGTAIVMEVKTGKIKAIANIGRINDGYFEDFNHAIGGAVEPGSTFKLASIMALLEDGLVDLEDTIQLHLGIDTFYNEEMRDASYHLLDSTTVRKAFEISSNVGIARLAHTHFGDFEGGGVRWIQHLKDFRLHQPLNIEIKGEAMPYVKEAYNKVDDDWSGITIPWMSIGYEIRLTPLQLLTFYNAVANNGMMMKPYLVTQTQHFGETLETFKPIVLKEQIASHSTIQKVRSLLEGVVREGTAKKLKTDRYNFAGKTGTAQMNYFKFDRTENIKYRASFAGYFPAENPVYSCIVMIEEPKQNGKYGSEVAGPVFREIADKCFTHQKELFPIENEKSKELAGSQLPQFDVGYKKDVAKILQTLNIDHTDSGVKNWAVLTAETDTLYIAPRYISRDIVPNVVGMGLRDALYVLENLELNVTFEGAGKVVRQSIKAGTRNRKQPIKLTLR